MAEISDAELAVLRSRANAFDALVHDIVSLLPPECGIRILTGMPFVEAVKGYKLVPVDGCDCIDGHHPNCPAAPR